MENITYKNKASANATFQKKDVYEQVTSVIIKQLEEGNIPWQKSWDSTGAVNFNIPKNYVTGNSYRGINIVLLWGASMQSNYPSNIWATFKQWQQKKEVIKKGEKGSLIVYADTFEKEVDNEIKKIPFLKTSYVFNQAQLVGYEAEKTGSEIECAPLAQRIDSAETFVTNTKASIIHHLGDAFYSIGPDKISMPETKLFIDNEYASATENYYSVLFHELTHWTAHPNRLDRKIRNKFGSHAYAQEELVAELGAAFLSAQLEITMQPTKDHAAYIANWLRVLKDNKDFVISAASDASKAVDYLNKMQLQ